MDILADDLGIDPAELRRQNFVRKEQFPYASALGFTYDSGDYHQTLDKALGLIGYERAAEGAGREARARRADGHRHLHVHRSRGRRTVEALRHSRHQDVRQRRDPHPSDGRRHRAGRHQVAGTGTRDDVGADRGRGARPRSAEHHGRGGRHRHRAVRTGHLREPQHAGRRRGHRDGGAPHSREGAQDRGAPARGRRSRRRVDGLQVPGEGRPGEDRDDEGRGVRGVYEPGTERAWPRGHATTTTRRT